MAGGDAQHDRLTRVEEALGFAERTNEQLHDEITELNRRVAELVRRLDGLEARLQRAAAQSEGGDGPDDAESRSA